jgi:FAD binding domain-containing protein/berberine-like enzyme
VQPLTEIDVETSPVELDALRLQVRGRVTAATDEGYAEACRLWNGMIERRPAAIVHASGNADAIAAVRYARTNGLPVSVRGGGHNVAGSALSDGGVVIDLGDVNDVRVDLGRRTVRAGGGARLGHVDHETQAFGLAVPFGVVSRTGVAGLTLHGGLGFLTRQLGLSCDNLVAADVITGDGRLLHVDENNHPDLLWALRGGGGNFGVVTSFEYRLHPVGPEVWMAITLYPADYGVEGLRAFGELMAGAPEELMALAIYWSAPHEEPVPDEWQGEPVFVAVGCWSGSFDEGEEAIRPLRELTTPVADMSGPMPFETAQQLFDPEYPDGRRYYWKSVYLGDLDQRVAEALTRHAASRPSPLSSLDVWALGGAMRREPPGGSAFAGRSDPFLLGIEANWDDPAGDEDNIGWAREVFRDIGRFSPRSGTYLNFPGFGEEGEELLRASYGESYERLQQIKAKYDPENLFRSALTITPQSG